MADEQKWKPPGEEDEEDEEIDETVSVLYIGLLAAEA